MINNVQKSNRTKLSPLLFNRNIFHIRQYKFRKNN